MINDFNKKYKYVIFYFESNMDSCSINNSNNMENLLCYSLSNNNYINDNFIESYNYINNYINLNDKTYICYYLDENEKNEKNDITKFFNIYLKKIFKLRCCSDMRNYNEIININYIFDILLINIKNCNNILKNKIDKIDKYHLNYFNQNKYKTQEDSKSLIFFNNYIDDKYKNIIYKILNKENSSKYKHYEFVNKHINLKNSNLFYIKNNGNFYTMLYIYYSDYQNFNKSINNINIIFDNILLIEFD